MRRSIIGGVGLLLSIAVAQVSAATVTGVTGGNVPVSNLQSSIGLSYIVHLDADANHAAGEVSLFGGSVAPAGWAMANGQTLLKNQNTTLFNAIGSVYGGNGTTTFALPDLRGRTAVGTGTGLGLTARSIGQVFGSESNVIGEEQMPDHTHTLVGAPGITGATGGATALGNTQPSLALNYGIVRTGDFPLPGGTTDTPFVGQIRTYAGTLPASGVSAADGAIVPVSLNTALFSIYGTNFGGNGQTTFAFPDLSGRTPTHTGGVNGETLLGEENGTEANAITLSQLPAHSHTVPGTITPTGFTGTGTPLKQQQPFLGLSFLIALEGSTPAQAGGSDPTIGEIALFGGSYEPAGWVRCDGQVLSVAQNQALFAVLGSKFGGNGTTTFALPDLRDRIAVGAGTGIGLSTVGVGDTFGANALTLTTSNLPAHTHTIAPEPSTIAVAALAMCVRRRRTVVRG
jgi:microcystin-dependent protein